ncbi:Opine oxidase subunit B [Pseudomonas chlororaphis subsp. aurantiaca]|nr:Opine oxidase subunit B [Pseudomonas chlororaphis subsp. aurantiaca]
MTVQQSDVLIVGGGLMGSAAAFFLRQRGQSVTLLERDQIGQYASGVNFGNVRRQGRYLGQLELANRSWALWKRLPELIDDDLEFIASGHMRVCYREDEIAELEAYAAAPEARQLDLKIYRGRELHERFPFLGPDVKGGSYAPMTAMPTRAWRPRPLPGRRCAPARGSKNAPKWPRCRRSAAGSGSAPPTVASSAPNAC